MYTITDMDQNMTMQLSKDDLIKAFDIGELDLLYSMSSDVVIMDMGTGVIVKDDKRIGAVIRH